jgi:hypothetical protein
VTPPPGSREIGVQSVKEPWLEALLEDGSVVRVKRVLVRAWRLPDGNGTEPEYFLEFSDVAKIISTASSGEALGKATPR